MKKFIVTGIVVILFVAIVLGLGYIGIIPGIGNVLGWNNPKDLGVVATAQDYNSLSEKLGRTRAELPDDTSEDVNFAFAGSHPVNASFTQEELTAQLQTRDFYGNPFSGKGQIKVNDDNTIEVSEAFKVDKLLNLVHQLGINNESIEDIINKVEFIKGDIPFYYKGNIAASSNIWDIDIQTLKIGPVTIPVDQIPISSLENAANQMVNSIAGLDVQSFSISRGKVNFEGMYPDISYYRSAE